MQIFTITMQELPQMNSKNTMYTATMQELLKLTPKAKSKNTMYTAQLSIT